VERVDAGRVIRSHLDASIRAALSTVFDPCSVAAGRPLSILDMGLVPGWELDGTTLRVRFAVTNGLCTMAPHFVEAARAALMALPGIDAVESSIDASFNWSPELIDAPPPPMRGKPQAWRSRA
jgi:metal-sulfur cluster biosynthetic enzyme